MPSDEMPKTPPMTYEYVPPCRPANNRAVANVPMSIGTAIAI